jgi:DNA topoisomerase VI subunit B
LYNNNDGDYVAQVAAKRYQRYLREEEKEEMRSKWVHDIMAVILMLIKLITNILQKANIEGKRVIEKVSVE